MHGGAAEGTGKSYLLGFHFSHPFFNWPESLVHLTRTSSFHKINWRSEFHPTAPDVPYDMRASGVRLFNYLFQLGNSRTQQLFAFDLAVALIELLAAIWLTVASLALKRQGSVLFPGLKNDFQVIRAVPAGSYPDWLIWLPTLPAVRWPRYAMARRNLPSRKSLRTVKWAAAYSH